MKEKISENLKKMSIMALEMVNLVYQGLMKNDAHYLDRALNKERILDNLERDVTNSVIQMSKNSQGKDYQDFIFLGQVAQNIERMGDELRSLMERIEIKISENLFFSEKGLEQYKDVFDKMRKSATLINQFLQTGNKDFLSDILENGDQIKKVVEEYRKEHVERLTKGLCEVRASNMYFDMLDFTGNVARHCTNIARIYAE